MIKCFLSHSSSDKDAYVRLVADRLRKEVTVFDENTFEAGMSAVEEISRSLDETTLFVIFFSDASLNSKWVKDELAYAKVRLDAAQIQRIYPIIIEPGIRHDDMRIPSWMRDSLNIQPILKPTIAARKINARLLELSWKSHPRLRERKEIFVGRNDLVKQIEERLDDFSTQPPIALIASGLPAIGRKSLLQYALRKSNVIRESYEFPSISLSAFEGIEDFILKILDFGIVVADARDQNKLTMTQKIELAKRILSQFAVEGERILIEDHGVLVQGNGDLVDWFSEILVHLAPRSHLTFCIASQFRPKPSINRSNPLVYSLAVKEMDSIERNGLLARYARFHSLTLARNELAFLADLLTGYPEQVLFAVDLVREEGIFEAKRQSHAIQQYGSEKAQVVLDRFKGLDTTLNFIYFLCRFEFLSYEVLFDIVDEPTYAPILNSLLATSVCERMGLASDYIRVNEVIRDFVSRNRFGLPLEFATAVRDHVKSFIERYDDDSRDISDYLFSAQEALRTGKILSDDLLIPSVFVKTIKRIYDEERNYGDAIILADKVLSRERFLHGSTVNHIRYILCQSLARLRDGRFFNEVKHLPEPDKSFLHGFYYRLSGDYVKAEESLMRVLTRDKKRRDPRAIGELVLVYMQSDEYDKAFNLAKENYRNRSSNHINANNYFACLIMKPRTSETKTDLEKIINRLAFDSSDRAQEMAESMRARMVAYFDDDETKSFQLIEQAIRKHPNINYPLLTKADLAAHFNNRIKLSEAISALERVTGKHAQSYRTFIKYKAMLLAMDGNANQAKELVQRELGGLIPTALQRLNERIDQLTIS